MIYRVTEPAPADWDAFVTTHPRAHILQQSAWGELKAAFGWRVARVALLGEAGRIVAGAQILFRPLPARILGTMAYIGMGPYVTAADQWAALWMAIHKCARQRRAAFLKCEPGLYWDREAAPDFAQWGFIASPQTVQPPRTIMIDIRGDEESILMRMNQGTRRKIRQSEKNAIHYYEGSRADVERFNAMLHITGGRSAFGVHESEYYQKAYDLFVPSGDAALIMAEHEGDALAGVMVFAKGETAWYLYGASSDIKRNWMASYGVQWAALRWARARGCTRYDMWGIPDEDERELELNFQRRSDGLWGVYGFKRGWGGQVLRSLGAWDRVYDGLIYRAYTLALRFQEYRQVNAVEGESNDD